MFDGVRENCWLQVRYNDQIKFESVKAEGQFLHCSARTFGAVNFHVLEYRSVGVAVALVVCHVSSAVCSAEVSLSAIESALTVIPHYRPQPSHDPKTFKVAQHPHTLISPLVTLFCV